MGTLVERTTRFTMLLHLPRMEGNGLEPRVKNVNAGRILTPFRRLNIDPLVFRFPRWSTPALVRGRGL